MGVVAARDRRVGEVDVIAGVVVDLGGAEGSVGADLQEEAGGQSGVVVVIGHPDAGGAGPGVGGGLLGFEGHDRGGKDAAEPVAVDLAGVGEDGISHGGVVLR